ncbi:DNA alkylation repair protein [Vibrio sp. JC009]|uniref:DNA alkylation repair protein n=1 Tax=Vibrio sp. JC009 TaxID=2912314 RepID=UPI0023B01F43|nr:DNA alkylation repair protein [Vibrio sp. JC009]WED22875.1 DNA alkylation repair protein [Vibrio sp. JC009]
MNTLFETLEKHADPEKAKQMSAYMKNQFPFLGIQTPKRRELCKPFWAERRQEKEVDWTFVEGCWAKAEREFQYVALDYLSKKKRYLKPEHIPRLKQLALTKSWWDSIDCLDRLIGDIGLTCTEVDKLMLEWSTDENFWLRRIAIDHQLNRKDKTNTALLREILINNLNQEEFFINKAIGWSLRSYSKIDPDWVRLFIAENREGLSALSIREGSKYL